MIERIITERLILRKPVIEDKTEVFHSYASDPVVTKYMMWEPLTELPQAEVFIKRCIESWDSGKEFSFVIAKRENSRIIGMIRLGVNGKTGDFGYVFDKNEWGKGYATEALKTILRIALEAFPGLMEISGICDIENTASARVMEKAGLCFTGIVRARSFRPNMPKNPRDDNVYSIRRSQFESAIRKS
ncbi:MAG: hypothetical protein A2Y33_03830 [Spirochaetes bacterium GWF1_51_8]|nr:MAG: hypothetical protein A2Y33_03830 [Spirochaetes bacterium GWF1_51_8]